MLNITIIKSGDLGCQSCLQSHKQMYVCVYTRPRRAYMHAMVQQ